MLGGRGLILGSLLDPTWPLPFTHAQTLPSFTRKMHLSKPSNESLPACRADVHHGACFAHVEEAVSCDETHELGHIDVRQPALPHPPIPKEMWTCSPTL